MRAAAHSSGPVAPPSQRPADFAPPEPPDEPHDAPLGVPVSSDETLVGDLLAADPSLQLQLDAPGGITSIGRDVTIKGELNATAHLVIEGRVEGKIAAPDHSVAVSEHGRVESDIFARSITIRGKAKGNLTAIECLKILPHGDVVGHLVARRLAIDEGAVFNGSADTHLTDAAIAVRRHRLKGG